MTTLLDATDGVNVPTLARGTITSASSDVATVTLNSGEELLLAVSEYWPDRRWQLGETLLVARAGRGRASVVHEGIAAAVAEGIIPELRDGTVRIMGVARAPGVRTKIAVAATVADVDPVSVCVGRSANRVRAISDMLSGERIDVVAWHPDRYEAAKNALQPAQVVAVVPAEGGHPNAAIAKAPRHQMAAAVGERGLNSSLAGQLTGLTINVEPA